MKTLFLIAGLVLCIILVVSVDDAHAEPNPVPLASVETDSETYKVMTHPHSPSLVVMHCSVTVEAACIERVFADVTVESSSGWPFEIRPFKLVFLNPRTQEFTVNVIVPPRTSPYGPYEFTVFAAVKAPGLARYVANATCHIVPMPVYTSLVEPIGSHCVVGEDGSARFPVRVWNTGTVEDVYRVDISSDEISIENWKPQDDMVVPPGSSVETNISVEYKEPDHPRQIRSIILLIASINSSSGVGPTKCYVGESDSLELFVYDRGPLVGPFPGLSPLTTVLIIQLACLVTALAIYFHRSRK